MLRVHTGNAICSFPCILSTLFLATSERVKVESSLLSMVTAPFPARARNLLSPGQRAVAWQVLHREHRSRICIVDKVDCDGALFRARQKPTLCSADQHAFAARESRAWLTRVPSRRCQRVRR
jgi:hypothetical protein